MSVLWPGPVGSSAARVLRVVRRLGPAMRDDVAQQTGLSAATVARSVSSLIEHRLLRERPDLVQAGAVGRPSLPVEVDGSHHLVLGIHLGRRVSTIALAGPDGRILASSRLRTPDVPLDDLVRLLDSRLRAAVAQFPDRRPLTVGLAGPWSELPWSADALRSGLAEATRLPVGVADHVAALATADLLSTQRPVDGSTLYFYARDTMAFLVAVDGHLDPGRRTGQLTHLPTGTCWQCSCGSLGCLGAAAGETVVAERAHQAGIIRRPEMGQLVGAAIDGNTDARELLAARAEILGRAAAVVRDMFDPDRIVLAGQDFGAYPAALPGLVAAFSATTTLPPLEPIVLRLGAGVQAVSATTVALEQLYADPLAIIRSRTQARRSEPAVLRVRQLSA